MPLERMKKEEGPYNDEKVVQLLECIHEAGYGDRKKQKKYIAYVLDHCIRIAGQRYGIHRSVKGWTKTFNRIRQEYASFIAKISESGRSGEEEDLINYRRSTNRCMR